MGLSDFSWNEVKLLATAQPPPPSLGDGSPAEKRAWSGSYEKESHQEGPLITSLVTGRHTGSMFHVSPLSFRVPGNYLFTEAFLDWGAGGGVPFMPRSNFLL